MTLPVVGDALPQRGNGLTKLLARAALRTSGWRIEGTLPDLPQFVAVAAPHQSSWDFFLGMLIIFSLGIRANWLAKHTLFRWPIGGIMRWLGGIAVNRTGRHNVVEQAVQAFNRRDQLIVGVAPEGTRRQAGCPVVEWKSGFYYIALGANVPILLLYIDNANRCFHFGPLIETTGDKEADLAKIQHWYSSLRSDDGVALA
ncbi:MAG: lysophospholipid acyltransferase family protein [Caldilineaceae bacterium]